MGVGDDSRKTIPKTARKRDCFSSGPIWPTTGTSTWDRRASIRECRRHHKAANGVFVTPSDADAGIIHRPPAISIPLSGPLEMKTGSEFQWMNQARLHNSFTFMRPYALRMQPYALIMHFSAKVEKSMKSRAESACREPYALYAPLLGVGPFFAFFLLRELHTVHTTAYGSHRNQALALLPVGIGASSARRNQKCIRRCIRLFRHATPYCPPLLETAGGIAPTTRRRGVMESPRIPHIHPFPSASSLSLISGMPLYAVFRPLWRAFAPRGAGWAGIAAIGPHRAAHGVWGSTRAEERRSVAASSHSPWLPPTHKALVTLEKTSRWNRRKGQGTTCPQRICLQAMRR